MPEYPIVCKVCTETIPSRELHLSHFAVHKAQIAFPIKKLYQREAKAAAERAKDRHRRQHPESASEHLPNTDPVLPSLLPEPSYLNRKRLRRHKQRAKPRARESPAHIEHKFRARQKAAPNYCTWSLPCEYCFEKYPNVSPELCRAFPCNRIRRLPPLPDRTVSWPAVPHNRAVINGPVDPDPNLYPTPVSSPLDGYHPIGWDSAPYPEPVQAYADAPILTPIKLPPLMLLNPVPVDMHTFSGKLETVPGQLERLNRMP